MCLCVSVSVCVCRSLSDSLSLSLLMHVSVTLSLSVSVFLLCMYTHIYTCARVYTYTCITYTCIYINMNTCMYVYIYIYMYMYIYLHIYIYITSIQICVRERLYDYIWQFPLKMLYPRNLPNRETQIPRYLAYNFKLRFWLNLNLYREIRVCWFGGFRRCDIFSGICHNEWYRPMSTPAQRGLWEREAVLIT